MDKATPTPSPASVDSFMSLLRNHENRISETYGVLQDRRIPSEEVRAAIDASWEARNALIAEVERLAAQAAPTERAPVVQATWPQEVQPDGTVNAVDPADMGASSGAAQAVRMLTEPEIKALTAMVWGAPCSGRDLAIVTSIVRAVEALQPGERPIDPAKGGRLLDVDACIPADGKIGSAA